MTSELGAAMTGIVARDIEGVSVAKKARGTPEAVQIIGRWGSNAGVGYTRYPAELMAG